MIKIGLKNIKLFGFAQLFGFFWSAQALRLDVAMPVLQAMQHNDPGHLLDIASHCSTPYGAQALYTELAHWEQVSDANVQVILQHFYDRIDLNWLFSVGMWPVLIQPAYVNFLNALYTFHIPDRAIVSQAAALAQAMHIIAEILASDSSVPVRSWKVLCDEMIALLEYEIDPDTQAFVQTLRTVRDATWPSVIGWYLSYHTQFMSDNMTKAGIKVTCNTNDMWGRLAESLAAI